MADTSRPAPRRSLEAWLDQVSAAARDGDAALATKLAVEALKAGVEDPWFLCLRARQRETEGELPGALNDYRRAHALAPRDPAILNASGLCLMNGHRPSEALACFDQALALDPTFGEAWFNRGFALERLSDPAEAERSYTRAVESEPRLAQAWANAGMLAGRRGDTEALHQRAARALALEPDHPTAVLALANIDFTPPQEVERSLRRLLEGQLGVFDRGLALGQLADALDAQDNPAEAFDAYRASNETFAEALAPRFHAPGQETAWDSLSRVVDWAEALDPVDWVTGSGRVGDIAGERAHVFLLGFPRSGTTLMETMLGAHPDVHALEERPTLAEGVKAFLADPAGLAGLASASGASLQPLREAYWRCVRNAGVDPRGKVFIDKNPWAVTKLPLIRKLFPCARILFAIRDPRDVVLSCFRRRFDFDPASYELLALSSTAAMYALSMRLANIVRQKLPFEEFQLNYEALVANAPETIQAACAFVGVNWRADMADVAGRARRGRISSASSAQIARGLYASGAGHWRRYREQLALVSGVLAPWVAHFGYPAE